MSTLSVQVRLGITRGWRVRTLNEFRFYNQAVAHCLFIFTALRARGYKEKIWTMHYTVFMSGKKYSIYIEYFLMPDNYRWMRGKQRYYVCTYNFPINLIRGFLRSGVSSRNWTFKSVPHMRPANLVRRFNKRKSKALVKNALWAWWARARILEVWHNTMDINRRNNDTMFNEAHRTMLAFAAEKAGYGTSVLAARCNHRLFNRIASSYANQKRAEGRSRALTKRAWFKKAMDSRLRSRYFSVIRRFRESVSLKKIPEVKRYKIVNAFRQKMRQATLLQVLTTKVIKAKKVQGNPETAIQRLYNEAISLSNLKFKQKLLEFKRLELAAKKAGKPFKQTHLEFCLETAKLKARKAKQEYLEELRQKKLKRGY